MPVVPDMAKGISIAWMSTLYNTSGGEVEDGEYECSPAHQGRNDVRDDPEWKGWLDEHMHRPDFMMLRIDDVPKRRISHARSKDGSHTFILRVPVQEFLEADERTVIRSAVCDLYTRAAKSLGLPSPPAPITN